MKHSFKLYTMGVLLASTLLTTGCSDYLDKLPEGEMPNTSIDFTNTADAYKPVVGIYGRLAENAREWGSLAMTGVRGDDVEKGGSSPADQGDLNFFRAFDYTAAKTFWVNKNFWMGYYDVVMKANLALGSLDQYQKYALNESDKVRIESYKYEVRFLRAYAYFQLGRFYGNIPVFTDNSSTEGYFKKPYSEVMRFIIAEADACAQGLPAVRPSEMAHKGAASRYSALALKAKAAAEVQDYVKVLEATRPIIEEGKMALMNDFYQLFNQAGQFSSENLFEIQYTYQGQEVGEAVMPGEFFIFQGPGVGSYFHSEKKFGANSDQQLGGGWGFLPVTKELSDLMEARGEKIRYQTTVLKTTGMTTPEGKEYNITLSNDTLFAGNAGSPTRYNGKAYSPSRELMRNVYGGDKNIIMFRYADILLLDAEAKVKTGGNGDDSFNEVRRRAGMSEMSGVTFEQIMEERFVELACENGERYFDMVRTGLAESAWKSRGYSAAKRFYPIHQELIDQNPSLAD